MVIALPMTNKFCCCREDICSADQAVEAVASLLHKLLPGGNVIATASAIRQVRLVVSAKHDEICMWRMCQCLGYLSVRMIEHVQLFTALLSSIRKAQDLHQQC